MEIISTSVEETYAFAATVADKCVGNEIILLNGDLGTGKTTFTKGFALALGITDTVKSPTFTLMKTYYGGRLKLHHFDLYRIENEGETEELGFEDCFDDGGVCVIEWNKFNFKNGEKVIKIDIYYDKNGRKIVMEGQ